MGRVLILLLFLGCLCYAQEDDVNTFPENFEFGVSTAAYQVEGAWNVDGKGENIWDHLTHNNPSFVLDEANGDDACKTYENTETDVALLSSLGINFYRFSISWSRILPNGHSYYVNEKGVQYYSDLIDALLQNGIEPIVTIYHWDLPQPLQELGGWPNPLLVDYFADYAGILFQRFGDRVTRWITINEPYEFCYQGYGVGGQAPGYTQDGIGDYLCSYTVLLAHAKVYHLYQDVYKETQQGEIGFSMNSDWFEPVSDSEADEAAAYTSNQMMLGRFAHPIYSKDGNWPQVMRDRIDALSLDQGYKRSRLPVFTDEQVEYIKGTADFFGLNHYTTLICTPSDQGEETPTTSYRNDVGTDCYVNEDWEASASWRVHPEGLRGLLNFIKTEYQNIKVIITENGYPDPNVRILNDCKRIEYYYSYLTAVLEAIHEDDCNVVGYGAWSFLDNFEWKSGYSVRFGLFHVDFEDDARTRTPRFSAAAYSNIIQERKINETFYTEDYACFPPSFQFGVATASYQVEGAWNDDGKGVNIWDHLTHTRPELIKNEDTGDIACDTYHKTAEDVQLLKSMGVDFYRFSISWSRILPTGHIHEKNEAGINYYDELIQELVDNGITPLVTMFHWDLPQPLQEIGGWPSEVLVDLFKDYADLLFEKYGDRVKHWITFNEPYQICSLGYSTGELAPTYKQDGVGGYMCSRTLLLAHAEAYHLYQEKYKATQNGKVGITVHSIWAEPESEDSAEDLETAEAHIQFEFGWFFHPIYLGDYPDVMKTQIEEKSLSQGFNRSRLPEFTPYEIDRIKGTTDFLGLNHYTTDYCTASTDSVVYEEPSEDGDRGGYCHSADDATGSASAWLKVVPFGFRKILNWIKEEYGNPEVWVTENGFSDDDTVGINDCSRINYYNEYLENLLRAIVEDDCNVVAYTAWSFLDNFEWIQGYSQRFGLNYVDFTSDERTRTPKKSSKVFTNIIETRYINTEYEPEGFEVCEED